MRREAVVNILQAEVARLKESLSYKAPKGDKHSLPELACRLGAARASLPTSEYESLSMQDLLDLPVSEDLRNIILKQEEALDSIFSSMISESLSISPSVVTGHIEALGKFSSLLSESWDIIKSQVLRSGKSAGTVVALRSLGVDKVSVVPNPGACTDCLRMYLDRTGSPIVFDLEELASSRNTDHRKSEGVHTFWKAVLPPAHLRCDCQLIPVEDGSYWRGTELVKSTSVRYEYWQGDGSPPPEGGWEMSPSGRSWRREVGSGKRKTKEVEPGLAGGGSDAEASSSRAGTSSDGSSSGDPTPEQELAFLNNTKYNPVVLRDHLEEGEITSVKPLDPTQKGINDSFRVKIKDNGSGILKGSIDFKDKASRSLWTAGTGVLPYDSTPKSEVGAYKLFSSLGLNSCPMTVHREHEGRSVSVQHWQIDSGGTMLAAATLSTSPHGNRTYKKGSFTSAVRDMIDKSKDPERFIESINEVIAMDVIMNNQDRHFGNTLLGEDESSIQAIDHGVCFANGMYGFKCGPMLTMASLGEKVVVPPKLKDRLDALSLSDVQESLASDATPWQSAQTFLRAKYVSFLQDTEGELHLDNFRSAGVGWSKLLPSQYADVTNMWEEEDREKRFEEATKSYNMAHDIFDSFAIAWLDAHAGDPSSPHHQDAKSILSEGTAFMGFGWAKNPQKYEQNNGSKKHEALRRVELAGKVAEMADRLYSTGTVQREAPKVKDAGPDGAKPEKKIKQKDPSLENPKPAKKTDSDPEGTKVGKKRPSFAATERARPRKDLFAKDDDDIY